MSFSHPAMALRAFVCGLIWTLGVASHAADWPTYRLDNQRTGVTSEELTLASEPLWTYQARHAPRPAWPSEPAKDDFWHNLRDLAPALTFDRVFHVAVANGAVFFGSSADDKITCLDAATGKERWSFFTEGPVRLAPAVAGGRVYAGSDDGWVYCLKTKDGALVWKQRVSPKPDRLPGNGRMISLWPVRTGVVVDGGVAYCLAGLFPLQTVYAAAFDAAKGSLLWRKELDSLAPQGYLMASGARLYVPMGRTSPAIVDRASGELLGRAPGPGGAYALLLEDTLVQGPGRATGEIHLSSAATQESLASFPGAVGIVLARGGMAYLYTRTEISALNRERYVRLKKDADQLAAREGEIAKKLKETKEQARSAESEELGIVLASVQESLAEKTEAMKACYLWKTEIETPFTAILACNRLLVGFDGRVAAFDAATGGEVWSAAVSGRAYGLATADGNLFASADKGTIQCFSGKPSSPTAGVAAKGAGDEKASGLPPYAEDRWTPLYRQAAMDAVETLRTRKGYCLVLGCGEGRLAYEIARISDLQVVGVESDAAKAAAARKALDKAGLYGVRVAVHEGSLASLPYPPHFANLIVSDRGLVAGDLPPSPEEARRALRPEGGTLYLVLPKDLSSSSQATSSSKGASGEPSASRSPADAADDALSPWFETFREMNPEIRRGTDTVTLVARRGKLPGSGEWTHPYADPGNTASSRDDLFAHPVRVQWFGEPGPREIVDRHNRPMASLYGNGRLFVPARDKVITLDAYNGASLWEAVIPHSTRVAINRDIGYMALADDCLYVAAAGKCVGLDVASGERRLDFAAPQVVPNRESDWGYIAVVGDRVFGSGQAPGASLKTPGLAPISEAAYYDFRPLVTSDYLFSLDRRSGQEVWRYRGGVIPNSGIALGDGGIYFFESRNPEAAADQTGRLRLSVLCAQGRGHIVKLDAETGGKLWERQVDLPFDHVLFLSYNNGVLLATGSRNHEEKLWYEFRAFNPGDGSPKWENRFVYGTTLDGGHGEQDQHPVIVGNRIYARPFDLDLQTGAQGAFTLDRGGHGCGGITASAKYLFGRGGNPQMVEIAAGGGSPMPLTRVTRPGCYLNMIPAGGLLLAPESSSGCTCDYAVQTSMAFAPKTPDPGD